MAATSLTFPSSSTVPTGSNLFVVPPATGCPAHEYHPFHPCQHLNAVTDIPAYVVYRFCEGENLVRE